MQEILADSVVAAGDSLAQNRIWHNRRFLWERILMDTLYPTAPAAVQAFYTANQTMGIGMLAKTDIAINQNNTTTALSQNSFVPANMYEAKMQQVNSVKIKLADSTGTMPVTATDISTLKNIANGCPDSYGKAFYEARSILNLLYAREMQFSSHCADGSSYRLEETEGINQIANNAEQVKVSLYPNPNTGMFEVNYDLSTSNTDGVLSILDLNGKVLATYSLKQNEMNAKIDASVFANGMYMYSIQAPNIAPITGKLVIIK